MTKLASQKDIIDGVVLKLAALMVVANGHPTTLSISDNLPYSIGLMSRKDFDYYAEKFKGLGLTCDFQEGGFSKPAGYMKLIPAEITVDMLAKMSQVLA